MPSSVPLSISVTSLPTEHLLLQLLSTADYQYIVTLTSWSASRAGKHEGGRVGWVPGRGCGGAGHERHELGGHGDEGAHHVAVLGRPGHRRPAAAGAAARPSPLCRRRRRRGRWPFGHPRPGWHRTAGDPFD